MTETEKIAEVIVAAVKASTAPILARCLALETQVAALATRAAVPGPSGPRGDSGPPGERGRDAVVDLDALAQRAAALVVPATAEPELAPDVVSAAIATMLREALGDALTPVKTQRVIVRDAQGQITAVREEPVA